MTPERFWEKVVKSDQCWDWTGMPNRDGYGRVSAPIQSERLAHRVSYALLVGPIPQGMELDHLCRNPACVNPNHLEPVDHRTNVLRGTGLTAIHARKTKCSRGHPLSGTNVRRRLRNGSWRRICRACDLVWYHEHKASKRASE